MKDAYIRRPLRYYRRVLISFAFILSATGCGQSQPEIADISANFTANGFKLYVEHFEANKVRFTIVENKSHENVIYSVYGVNTDSQIPTFNTAVQVRSAHRVDSAVGKSFEVEFRPEDNWFVFFRDDYDGTAWIYSTGTEIIRGQFRNNP